MVKGRAPKNHQSKSIKLAEDLCPFAEQSLEGSGVTAAIEMGLRIMKHLAEQAKLEDARSINLLAKHGLQVHPDADPPIVIRLKK